MLIGGKPIDETELYRELFERYVFQVKEKALDPFIHNETFRRAVRDFGTDAFKANDPGIREDVEFLIDNLCTLKQYAIQGAREVCLYVIDNMARSSERAESGP
jgi:hypothetical protein